MQQFNQVILITEEKITMEENIVLIGDTRTFCFNFQWSKDVDDKMKHEIEFIMKNNDCLAEFKMGLNNYC